MSLSSYFFYTGDLGGLQAALATTTRFKCECGDELQVGGEISEHSAVVREWKESHRGKHHAVVRLES